MLLGAPVINCAGKAAPAAKKTGLCKPNTRSQEEILPWQGDEALEKMLILHH